MKIEKGGTNMNDRGNFYGRSHNQNSNSRNTYQGNQPQQETNRYPGITPKDYFKGNGIVNEDLFVTKANEIAESFSKEGGIKGNQIRKFYDEVLRLKLKLNSADNESQKFNEILPYIKMLIPKAIYSKSKKTANNSFESFIKMNIAGISELKQFYVFCDLFEAVVAYCKKYPNLKDS